jgi:deazaflavin-dependent oxidoreductase (nitroreductase family)
MLRVIALAIGGLVATIAALGTVFFAGMRRKSPSVLRAVRRFNRAIMNPRMLVSAGTPGAYASIIHHVGRTTGLGYRTPVVAEPTPDGFVIALPYGTTANWVKNVLAAGSATIVHGGSSHEVNRPEVVPLTSVVDCFPPKDIRTFARFRIDQCMRLRHVQQPERPGKSAHDVAATYVLKP